MVVHSYQIVMSKVHVSYRTVKKQIGRSFLKQFYPNYAGSSSCLEFRPRVQTPDQPLTESGSSSHGKALWQRSGAEQEKFTQPVLEAIFLCQLLRIFGLSFCSGGELSVLAEMAPEMESSYKWCQMKEAPSEMFIEEGEMLHFILSHLLR